jgi:hypothetical protein
MTAKQASGVQEPTRQSQPNSLHPEKRMERGVEDIAHLFLTQPPSDETILPATGEIPSVREIAAPSNLSVAVARPAAAPGKEEIIQLLNKNAFALESGLRVIDRAVPYDSSRTIDLLAVDTLCQLVVIALASAPDDGMLLRAISQVDWIAGHVPILRRLYRGQAINFSSQPRVILVAPEFSQQVICAAHLIQSPRIGCYRYRAIAIPSGTAVLFEGA